MEKLIGIILMGGSSERFGGPKNKLLCSLDGKSVFTYSLDVFSKSELFERIIVIANENIIVEVNEYISKNSIKAEIYKGGQTRQESVEIALNKISDAGKLVLIHDAARPLIDEEIIKKMVEAVSDPKVDAATTYIPVVDTIASFSEGFINNFLDRKSLVQIQTPQIFKIEPLKKAHSLAKNLEATDDCSLLLSNGYNVKLVEGSKKLHKVTTVDDIRYLEGFCKLWRITK